MLKGAKVLVTGATGGIGHGLATSLAAENEVWCIARFSDPAERGKLEDRDITTRTIDLDDPDFSELPRDFTHLVHCAMVLEPEDYGRAIRVNAEGTGLLMSHCRSVKSALVMSTLSVYKPDPDPWHAFVEADPLGDVMAAAATYSISKIAQEAVARFCAREFSIPTTIARMGAAYSERGGLPTAHLHAVAQGKAVPARWDPLTYSPIHHEQINAQLADMLEAASTPAFIVNWCGDQAVSVQQWSAWFAELLGKQAKVDVTVTPGASIGTVGDTGLMRAVTQAAPLDWKDGFRSMTKALYPELMATAGTE